MTGEEAVPRVDGAPSGSSGVAPHQPGDQPGHLEDAARMATTVGLLIGALLLAQAGGPSGAVVGCLILVVGALLLSLNWRMGAVAIVVLVVVGVILRFDARGHSSSDVLTVTKAAIDLVLAGGNPYGHGFIQSNPPGAPFAYGPLALLWYAPAGSDPRTLELAISLLILALLALRGRVLGLAIYATMPVLYSTAADGSNDTSAGLLLLVALLACRRWPRAGAVLLAFVVAFKLYALAWLLPLIGYAGAGSLVAFLIGSLVAWGPAAALWGPGSIAWSLQHADEVHPGAYYSLAYAIVRQFPFAESVFSTFRYGAGIAVAIVSVVLVRSDRSFILAGVAVFLATLFLGWWSTYAYFAAIAPILCWSLDDWMGLGRVPLPRDLAGRLEARLDRRWPVRRSWRALGTDAVTTASTMPA
jgi:hypothetical protein